MNEDQIKLFLDVVELGSFQKVAEKNYVSQRAVSRQIQRLESELNTQLFNRGKNKIMLTKAGKFFEKRSRALQGMLSNTKHELHRFSYRGETRLSIGYFSPFDALLVHAFLNNSPYGSNSFVSEEGIEHLISDVATGNLDCAIIVDDDGFNYDYEKMGLAATKIYTDRMLIGISSDLADTREIREDLLQKLPVAYYSNEDSSYLKQIFINSLHGRIKPLEVLQVDSFEHLQILVGTGQALSFYPEKLSRLLKTPVDHIHYLDLNPEQDQTCEFKLIYKNETNEPTLLQAIDYFERVDIERMFAYSE
ncbi:LysR family transcriptional regulator [Lactobacillaceae bacterium 24-114]